MYFSRYAGKTDQQIVEAITGTLSYPLPDSYYPHEWSPALRTDFEHKRDLLVFKFPRAYHPEKSQPPTNLRVRLQNQRGLRFRFAVVHPSSPVMLLRRRVGTIFYENES